VVGSTTPCAQRRQDEREGAQKSARSCAVPTTLIAEWSGPQRVRDLLPEEADDLLRRRFRHHPVVARRSGSVETFPLNCDL